MYNDAAQIPDGETCPVINCWEEMVMNAAPGVFGYIFLDEQKKNIPVLNEQQITINKYAFSLGLQIDEIFVERKACLQQPLAERAEGAKILNQCRPGDIIITAQSEWVLCSAKAGGNLLRALREENISLHSIDLGGNISLAEKRKLRVHEGYADIIQKLLAALAVCENKKHGDAIKAVKQEQKQQGKYLGGPVPFGWDVDEDGFFVQNAAQQNIIEAIICMREDRWSYRDISTKLRKEFDVQLSHAGVRKVLAGNKRRKAEERSIKGLKSDSHPGGE